MNRKGFTLVELLGVVVILSIIMMIAIPNITSVLKRSERDSYIADAKKFVSQVEYELRKGNINKPSSTELVKITLGYLSTNEVKRNPDGVEYHLTNSYVVVARKNGYLTYYVNLVTVDDEGVVSGIRLVDNNELDKDDRYKNIQDNITLPTDSDIKSITGINGVINAY